MLQFDIGNSFLALLANGQSLTFQAIDLLRTYPFLPVAPQHTSLASNSTTDNDAARGSAARYRAIEAPEIPLPTMTTSAFAGSS